MNEKSVKISVFIAFYNAENFAERTLDSVINQTFQNFELICVDDGSTDSTLKILNKYSEKDKRIKVFSKSNGGIPAASFNYAIDRSSGEYVFALGHDDQISKDALEKMCQRAVQTNADCIVPDLYYSVEYDPSASRMQIGFRGDRQVILTNKEAVIYSLKWDVHAACLFRGNIIRRIRFHEKLMNSCELSARVFLLNCNHIVFSEGTYIYNLHRNSITRRFSKKIFDVAMTNYLILKLLKENDFDHKTVEDFEIECFIKLSDFYWVFIKGFYRLSSKDRQYVGALLKNTYLGIDKLSISKALLKHGNITGLKRLKRYCLFIMLKRYYLFIFCTIFKNILKPKNSQRYFG